MAATTQSTEYAAQVAATTNFNDRIDDNREIGGSVQFARIEVPLTTDNDANDVITLIELPEGAIVIPELSKVLVSDDFSSGAVTVDIGDETDVDRYADGINLASVGTVDFTSVLSATVPAGLHTRHKVNEDTKLVLMTLVTAAATIEAGVFIVILAYKTL